MAQSNRSSWNLQPARFAPFSARHLYEATRTLGHDASPVKSAAQRRAEEMMALRKGKR